jgi:hypothetical protein
MTQKICRVCGKQYKACRNSSRMSGGTAFRWREVACSPRCGQKYFEQTETARNRPPQGTAKKKRAENDG